MATSSATTRRRASEDLVDRAWALHCEGHKAPAIGERLGVSQRTVRSWIARVTKELAANRDATRAGRLALAVDRHLAVAAAAWDAFHRAEDLDRASLDDYRAAQAERRARALAPEPDWPRPEDFGLDPDTLDPAVKEEARRIMASAAQATPSTPPRPKLDTLGARYLALALQAQRAVARLEGLHVYVPEPDKHEPGHILLAPPDHMVIPEEDVEAWRAFRQHYYDNGGVPVRPEAQSDAIQRMADDLARGTLDPAAADVPTDEENPFVKSAESATPDEDGVEAPASGDLAPSSAEMTGDAPFVFPDRLEISAISATSSAHVRAAAAAAHLTPVPNPKKPFPADIDFPYLIPFEESRPVLRAQEEDDQDRDRWAAGPDPTDTPFDPDKSYP